MLKNVRPFKKNVVITIIIYIAIKISSYKVSKYKFAIERRHAVAYVFLCSLSTSTEKKMLRYMLRDG
jgi:hypothetical protein